MRASDNGMRALDNGMEALENNPFSTETEMLEASNCPISTEAEVLEASTSQVLEALSSLIFGFLLFILKRRFNV
jgi:hypothetical protein